MKQLFSLEQVSSFKQKALQWANQFPVVCYLDSNETTMDKYGEYECLLAISHQEPIIYELNDQQADLKVLQRHHDKHKNWLFGFITYDVKNTYEPLVSKNLDSIKMPALCFFEPDLIISIPKNILQVNIEIFTPAYTPHTIWQQIINQSLPIPSTAPTPITLQPRLNKAAYLEKIKIIQQHIRRGDIYETNFCQEFFAEKVSFNPLNTFTRLNTITAAPFAAYVKVKDKYLLCGSPERYIKKIGNKVLSQPIKGTIKKGKRKKENEQLKQQLYHDIKERAENVMIVDLVRNDLTKVATFGTIKVEELFGIYSFPTVHHLISTITAELRPDLSWIEALEKSFPMGSMTGAPKIRAMQLMEKYETTKRGLYAGTVGYIKPSGDFDFNVVIRSLLYNASNQYLSLQVGGAITAQAVPEKEYEECLLKAQGILTALASSNI